MSRSGAGTTGVVLPLRSFREGKARLAATLDPPGRLGLAMDMAATVMAAADGRPAVVVSSDPDVTAWARDRGADTLPDPGRLDAAARAGLAWCRSRGLARAVVVHGDLPLARSLAPVDHDAGRPVAVLVPCHRDDGTTVLSVPAAADFGFAYGPGSFRRHGAEARRLGLAVRVVRDPRLGFDVDVADDLARLHRLAAAV